MTKRVLSRVIVRSVAAQGNATVFHRVLKAVLDRYFDELTTAI
jgi:hypothetical protein